MMDAILLPTVTSNFVKIEERVLTTKVASILAYDSRDD